MARSLRKPTKTMRADAWRALHSIAVDPDSGDSAKVSAARALIAGDPELAKKEAAAEEASRWPKVCLSLPDNSRDGEDACGLTETDYSFTIIYDGNTPEGLADYAVGAPKSPRRISPTARSRCRFCLPPRSLIPEL